MQFRCFVFELIIHVSDQPVAPSLGFVHIHWHLAAVSRC